MEADVPNTPGPASPPDPPQDQPGKTAPVPEYIAAVLHAVSILLGYGRHLLGTVRHRAAAPTFPTIAACFGTANLSTILAHLNRGILRAAALERFLLARAATGRDIDMVTRRTRTDRNHRPRQQTPNPNSQPTSQPSPKPRHARRCPPARTIPNSSCPHRRNSIVRYAAAPIGRTIGEICSDLAVVPGFCTPAFWNGLFEIMHYFGGDGVAHRDAREDPPRAGVHSGAGQEARQHLGLVALKRDEIRQILGFFIGEPPVDPFAAALATGPP